MIGTGSRPVSLLVGGDLTIEPGARFSVAASGQNAGAGGGRGGGSGAGGATGGSGGAGGGGGSAIELAALGRLVYAGSVDARGADGSDGTDGGAYGGGTAAAPGAAGKFGFLGQWDTVFGVFAGDGGNSGDGKVGGSALVPEAATAGGPGGGGAGGTIKLNAAALNVNGGVLRLAGGNGAEGGRLIFAAGAGTGLKGSLEGHATIEVFDGPRRANPFLEGGATETPYLVDDFSEPEAFGVAGAVSGPDPSVPGALALIERIDNLGTDYLNFDVLQISNLTDQAMSLPRLGVELDDGSSGFLASLLEGGYDTDARFNPAASGPVELLELGAYAIYRTLVPQQSRSR